MLSTVTNTEMVGGGEADLKFKRTGILLIPGDQTIFILPTEQAGTVLKLRFKAVWSKLAASSNFLMWHCCESLTVIDPLNQISPETILSRVTYGPTEVPNLDGYRWGFLAVQCSPFKQGYCSCVTWNMSAGTLSQRAHGHISGCYRELVFRKRPGPSVSVVQNSPSSERILLGAISFWDRPQNELAGWTCLCFQMFSAQAF